MLRAAIVFTLLSLSSTASGASYIDAPTIGRSTTGFALYGGAPGGGTEITYGYAWESGWSVASLFGAARYASTNEGYAGVATRWVPFDTEISPFLGGSVAIDYAHAAVGPAMAARIGVRFREHPLDLFGAFEARHSRLSDDTITTRYAIVIGIALEGAAQ